MVRADFTVVGKSGVRWAANHLSVSMKYDHAARGMVSVLSFISSGQLQMMLAAEVEKVEFHPHLATYCSECESSLHGVVGAGIHANPVPPSP